MSSSPIASKTLCRARHPNKGSCARCPAADGRDGGGSKTYAQEWKRSKSLQEEFHDMNVYITYRCAEERISLVRWNKSYGIPIDSALGSDRYCMMQDHQHDQESSGVDWAAQEKD